MAFKEHNKPLFIEFIGVSGVGKTTLYKKLDLKKKQWIPIGDYLRKIKVEKDDLRVDTMELYQKFCEINFDLLHKTNMSSFDKFRIAAYRYRLIRRDIPVYLREDKAIIITDDGLFHNSNAVFLKLYQENKKIFKEFIKNRCFFYCYSTPEIIAKQIMERYKKRGFIAPQHKNRTFEDLVFAQNKMMQSRENLISILEKENVPVLRINTSENDEDNVRKIYRFVSKLQQD